MTNNEYMIEVQITLPGGESLDDWKHVGHFFDDLDGDKLSLDLLKVGKRISCAIDEFERKEEANGVRSPVAVSD